MLTTLLSLAGEAAEKEEKPKLPERRPGKDFSAYFENRGRKLPQELLPPVSQLSLLQPLFSSSACFALIAVGVSYPDGVERPFRAGH